jgi:uncharacterized membrane protein YkvA (DUF1232 family)
MDRFLGVSSDNNAVGVLRQIRLAWRLWRDKRVPWLTKLIPMAGLAYLVIPFDLLADPMLGLGQLDDIGVILLAVKAFVSLCPAPLVAQHRQHLAGGPVADAGDVVDATYRVLDESDG